MFKDFFH
jgi:hypothetical protein